MVADGSALPPVFSPADTTSEHGWGMVRVDATADRWGVDTATEGKQVWWEHHWTTPI